MKTKCYLYVITAMVLLFSCNSKKNEYDPYKIIDGKPKKEVSKSSFEIKFKDIGTQAKAKTIHVKLNDAVSFDALFDTGCSYVSISEAEALPLMKAGTLSESNHSGYAETSMADGNRTYQKVYELKMVSVVDTNGKEHTLYDVPTTIESNMAAPFLLGTYVIDNLAQKSYTVDLKKNVIRFE